MRRNTTPRFDPGPKLAMGGILLLLLSGCDDAGTFKFQDIFTPKTEAESAPAPAPQSNAVEQDVEAPDVFAAREPGLWDGRPSLGGVWVAHPDVTEPERVLIRNTANGQFVVGALFRRERDIPGPRLQISSDAAQALGVLAGAPSDLDVVALRKEAVAVAPAEDAIDAPAQITQTSLDPIAAAGAAIEDAPETPADTAAAAPTVSPLPQSTLPQSTIDKPFIQIGIFSQEANANRAAKQMRGAGLIPTVKQQQLGGKPFWRVIVGPANSTSERGKLLETIKREGFSDAYAVTN
ncbi:sporulation protein [Roseobacter cerasinus]|uniref:Sporulation protein n=1 Tax=Roseobacter cerasinus TaxID=2602289 RepID=A0A640VWK6_9RHOB|nr:SPOR domain-containing protein [Roseobacter cerasinus]GFE52409.1 sporulation protein [Roseobacter cerasinus]